MAVGHGLMDVRFLEVDGAQPAADFIHTLGRERESWLLERLRVLRDLADEGQLPSPLFEKLAGRAAAGLQMWKVTIDYGSEAYLFVVRRHGDTWYVIHALRDRSVDGKVLASDVALAVRRWKALDDGVV